MSCETYRELLALRLYDELDEGEKGRLAEHLTQCAACRAAEVELREGLGSLMPQVARAELPADWVERLRAEVATTPRPAAPLHRTAWYSRRSAAAAGFAAGVLCTWALLATAAAPVDDGADPGSVASSSSFRRAEPPPRATGGIQVGTLTAWLAR